MPMKKKNRIGRTKKRRNSRTEDASSQGASVPSVIIAELEPHPLGHSECILSDLSGDTLEVIDEVTSQPLEHSQEVEPHILGDSECILSDICDDTVKVIDGDLELDELTDCDGFSAHEFYIIVDDVAHQYDPSLDNDELYHSIRSSLFTELNSAVNDTQEEIRKDTGYIKYDQSNLYFLDLYQTDLPSIRSAVKISAGFEVTIYVHRKPLGPDHAVMDKAVRCRTVEGIWNILKQLSEYSVCVGNPDAEFSHLKTGVGELREDSLDAQNGSMLYSSTFRSERCELLIDGLRCKECIKKRGALRKRRHSEMHSRTPASPEIHSSVPHSAMSHEQLSNKIKSLQKNRRSLDGKLQTLRNRLQRAIERCEGLASQSESSDIHGLVKGCSSQVAEEWPDENSFQRIFWEEQLKFNASKKPSGMRWHPMIIKWALHLKTKSSAAYSAMRETGFVKLPSARTLFNYSKFMEATCGISLDTIKHFQSQVNQMGLLNKEYTKYVGILLDEVRIKEDLVYDRTTGELIGFIDLDRTGNQLVALENALTEESPKLARYMMVLMVRGACSEFKYPLACYATDGIQAELLDTITLDAISDIELNSGLKVLYVTCDGASPNRRFFSLHGDQKPVWSTRNPHDRDRRIYFISDVPHLMKTARNCLSNSGSHRRSRNMWNNNKDLSWMHVVDLYRGHCEDRELSVVPKLSRSHIDLTAFSTMKVSYAAEVLSESVASAMELYLGDYTEETVRFIRFMNKFFDCLNTRNLSEAITSRNQDKCAYTSVDDERLGWLTGDFLQYLEDWRYSVDNRPGDFSKGDRAAMMLSHQTLAGLEITARSTRACIEVLLTAGAPFVLTSHFNQDVLEQLFGHFRHRGGSMENPTVRDVRNMMVEMKATRSVQMACVRGNTKRQGQLQMDNTPLPKRHRPL